MIQSFTIRNRNIGAGTPAYIIAEMSANFHQSLEEAIRIIHSAKESGADAVKLQTASPDKLTLDSDAEYFRVKGGTLWDGRILYGLYDEVCMPWDWQPQLKALANDLGMDLFSTAFDPSAVDFLEEMDVPVHKIASFEIVDIPLIEKVARTGKPLIISTGMADLGEIEEAVNAARAAGATQIALLKCTSAYPAMPEEMNLRTIPHLAETFGVPIGLSDHTLDIVVPVAAVAMGACIVEKHFTLSRDVPGPDSAFSLEPHEFRAMVDAVRVAEKALGAVNFTVTEKEMASRVFRRSLFVVQDMAPGDTFTAENVRSVRPGHGLHTRYYDQVLGCKTTRSIERGTPLSWELVGAISDGE